MGNTLEDRQILQPLPVLDGGYVLVKETAHNPECVKAEMTCKDCGHTVYLTLVGQASKVDPVLLHRIVQRKACLLHKCPAIKNTLSNKLQKFFPDLLRGAEMVQETNEKLIKGNA